ncbi:MAG: hypothetical protein ACOC2W_00175 [bacterium]
MESVLTITESTINDTDSLKTTIMESIRNTLPNDFKKYYASQKNRKETLIKYGKKAFLMPDRLKFPVVNPNTGKNDCRLIYAAYLRANQWSKKKPEYNDIAKKAKSLYDDLNCSNKIKIHIQDSEIYIGIEEFLHIFDAENV